MDSVARKTEVSKLLCMADNVVTRNRAYKAARAESDPKKQEQQYGRLSKSIDQLQETAEHFRKAGQP